MYVGLGSSSLGRVVSTVAVRVRGARLVGVGPYGVALEVIFVVMFAPAELAGAAVDTKKEEFEDGALWLASGRNPMRGAWTPLIP